MSISWLKNKRGKGPLERLFSPLLNAGWGAAEGLLGLVAMVLVVWLLWPEGSGPQIDKRVAWEQSVRAAEQRLERLEAERTLNGIKQDGSTTDETTSARVEVTRSIEPAAEPIRRRIAKLSELADPLDKHGRRPGQLALNNSFKPAPRKPGSPTTETPDPTNVAVTDGDTVDGEASSSSVKENIRAALADLANQAAKHAVLPEPGAAPAEASSESADLAIAALSNEALGETPDVEPLPEVDLSDLDSLVPEDAETPIEAQESEAQGSSEAPVQTAALNPDQPEATGDAGAFVVEGDSAPDVARRPRDDAPTWLRNAVTASWTDDRPIIAVVIDDLGLNRSNTAALNDLPSPLTLAFLPYAGRIEAQTKAAKVAGHELLLHLPMEPLGPQWPGPNALTTKLGQEEFEARLQANLNGFDGFVGINNHMGSRLTADRSRMEVVMRELRERDVLFLDSKTNPRSVASKTAGSNGVPNTDRDVFLDHVIDLETIRRQLSRAEQVARQTGSAVAIGHPHNVTIKALRSWLPGLEARGVRLAPISAVVARRACDEGILIAADTCGRYLQAKTPSASAVASQGG